MRAPRRHRRMSPGPSARSGTSRCLSSSVTPTPTPPPRRPYRAPPLASVASMPTSLTGTPNTAANANRANDRVIGARGGPHVTSKPVEEPTLLDFSPSSSAAASLAVGSFPTPTPGIPTPPTITTRNTNSGSTRHGTKRSRGETSSMCRRGSDAAGDDPERVVVALAPCAPVKPTPTIPTMPTTPTPTATISRSLAFAAATATAHVHHQALDASDQTIAARVQRLLVQVVLLPVVWMSLCCVITAAMGIEAMESIQNALVHDANDHGQDDHVDCRPTKKAKRAKAPAAQRPHLRPTPRDMASLTDDEPGVVYKHKSSTRPPQQDDDDAGLPTASLHALPPSTTTERVRRTRRRVLIWDLDETLVLFASLYSGQFARTHDVDLATSVALGEQMMTYLLAVLERHFFFRDLHDADIDHISCVASSASSSDDTDARAQLLTDRYTRIRAIYERRSTDDVDDVNTRVDFLDDPTSQWFTARQALVTSIDMLSTGWIREAHELLALAAAVTSDADNDVEVVNVMVTNTQLSPALCKCLIYGLDVHFPIERVYSSSKLHKMHCFQTIMATYAATTDCDVDFVGIGDGAEEEHVSQALGIPFCKIRSLHDLRQLRYELELAETPRTVAASALPTPTTTPSLTPTLLPTRVPSPPSVCATTTANE